MYSHSLVDVVTLANGDSTPNASLVTGVFTKVFQNDVGTHAQAHQDQLALWVEVFHFLSHDVELLPPSWNNQYDSDIKWETWLTAFIQCYSLLMSLIDSFYTVLFTAFESDWQLLYSAIHCSQVWLTASIQCYSLLLSLIDSFYTVLFTALESDWQLSYSAILQLLYSAIRCSWSGSWHSSHMWFWMSD